MVFQSDYGERPIWDLILTLEGLSQSRSGWKDGLGRPLYKSDVGFSMLIVVQQAVPMIWPFEGNWLVWMMLWPDLQPCNLVSIQKRSGKQRLERFGGS